MKIISRLGLLGLIFTFFDSYISAQENIYRSKAITLGAYYFDGWTGATFHPTPKLKKNFLDRKPIWGWKTSTPSIINKQILEASNSGLSFFTFCWYYNPHGKNLSGDVKNNALKIYLKSEKKDLIDFSLLIVNHKGYYFKKDDWPALIDHWSSMFVDASYLRIGGKPLISFYSVQVLVDIFGSTDNVKIALESLRSAALEKNLDGVFVAACVSSPESIRLAEQCGFDILTGYNYHELPFKKYKSNVLSITTMQTAEKAFWNTLKNASNKPLIPTITLNWDKRPWESFDERASKRFSGFSGASVATSIQSCKQWIYENRNRVVEENIAMLYAWNEYGEGAWLTPSKVLGRSLLNGVKKGIGN